MGWGGGRWLEGGVGGAIDERDDRDNKKRDHKQLTSAATCATTTPSSGNVAPSASAIA